MLFDIDNLCWDEELCARLGIPMSMLPVPVPSSMVYGQVTAGLPGLESLEGIPVCGSAGDQAAALLGQACIVPGQAKNTYGTGCFTLMNTGSKSVRSVSGLVTSVAWSVNGKTTYALEGSVFNAGSSIQWLRDELGLIGTAHECDILAESVPDNGGVYLVSAFTGLGAPRWDMYARGAIVGLTRGSNKAHIARATLEGIAYQVKDLLDAMQVDAESPISVLRVDGGASVSSFLMQFQADMLRVPIDRPKLVETTAFGAAFLAGLACGVWESVDDIALLRQSDRIFKPEMDADQAKQYHDNWLRAVGRAEKVEPGMNRNLFFTPTDILLPVHADMRRWSIIACDQFTADAGYWQAVQDTVGDAPSTLRLMLPEFYLGKCDEGAATREIQQTMHRYLDGGVFRTVPHSLVLVQRTLPGGATRCGIVGALDLEAYDYAPDSVTPIRATEGTVASRLPARVRIRAAAALEMPHIMVFLQRSG